MSEELEKLANDLTTGDLNYKPDKMGVLNKMARSIGSDWGEAVSPTFYGGAIARALDKVEVSSLADQGVTEHYAYDREYRGQNIEFRGDEEKLNYYNNVYGVEKAPDLLGVFVGAKSPKEAGLQYSVDKPGKYPWGEDTKVYDATPYVEFKGFRGSDEAEFILKNKIDDLDPKESISWQDLQKLGISIEHHTSVDFGERVNWSIGKTDEGDVYLAIADIWDFKDMGPKGNVMEKFGKGKGVKNMGFYGRFDVEDRHFLHEHNMYNDGSIKYDKYYNY